MFRDINGYLYKFDKTSAKKNFKCFALAVLLMSDVPKLVKEKYNYSFSIVDLISLL